MQLEVKSVSKSLRGIQVLEKVSCCVEQGEVVGLVGPNGAGKTTLLRLILGLLSPDEGRVIIDGRPAENALSRERVGYCLYNDGLYPALTGSQNLVFFQKALGVNAGRVDEMIELLGLSDVANVPVSAYSKGMRRRLAIARSMLSSPALLLLDEPFSALDAKIRQQMREELKKIQSELGITVVFVTHDQEEAMAISHRIVVMNKGVFEQIGTPTEIYDKPASRYVASFIGEMNFLNHNGKIIAARPEDITISDTASDFTGTIRTLMVLGHYEEVTIQCGSSIVRCFATREQAKNLLPGQQVHLGLNRYHEF